MHLAKAHEIDYTLKKMPLNSLLCCRFPCARPPAKPGFPGDASVRRGILRLFHFDIVVVVRLDLFDGLFECRLLCVDVFTAEVFHPSVVAD
jgi:hypothetical protein